MMGLETQHKSYFSNAQEMSALSDDSVELVVTSPPYPMIEMWDELFADLNPNINECLSEEHSHSAFDLMHQELEQVWAEIQRVLCPGGIVCINIGDATRKLGDTFELHPNHARITRAFQELGFTMLPSIQWKKPTNKGNKFMGSGMLPPNAYVTLEHEYILIFRNGCKSRSFESGSERRYGSAYFWEERNQWYSDTWTDIQGEHQSMVADTTRDRSAAYPFELPFRLIQMYSVQGDTVLDPFWGTGTTSLAAMVVGRNSVGYELDTSFQDIFRDRVNHAPQLAEQINTDRLSQHNAFVANRDTIPKYSAKTYNTRVMTKQEQNIRFWSIAEITENENCFSVQHEQFEGKEKKEKEDAGL